MHTGRRRREWCTQVYFTLSECLGTLSTPRRPAHKCLRVYLMSATDNKGIPQLDAHQTTSLHPLHHLAMWHHIILFRSAWPSGGGAHEQRQRERQQDPRRCIDEGQEYAPHLPCARLEAQRKPPDATFVSLCCHVAIDDNLRPKVEVVRRGKGAGLESAVHSVLFVRNAGDAGERAWVAWRAVPTWRPRSQRRSTRSRRQHA